MRLMRARRQQAGFSLIEVLIALLVLALGLLGLALLQTMNLRFTQSAEQRSIATNLAYELVDRMRSQRVLVSRYSAITAGSFAGVDPDSQQCLDAIRDLAMTADANIQAWRCQLRAALPDATADVTVGGDGGVRVEIRWADSFWETDAVDRETEFVVESQL